MSIGKFFFVLCLLLCVCCLFGIYRLQAQPQRPPTTETTETQSDVGFASKAQSDVRSTRKSSHEESSSDASADFTQTIIEKNLFAPLGTVLNPKPQPGANLMLVGTFVQENPIESKALIKNRTTGRQHVLAIGEVLGEYQVTEIQPKAVRLSHTAEVVTLHLPKSVLLNAKRR